MCKLTTLECVLLGTLVIAAGACARRDAAVLAQGRAAAATTEKTERGFDQPDEAEEYYRAKRSPSDPSIKPMDAYRRAREQRRHMPGYSLARGGSLPSLSNMASSAADGREPSSPLPAWEPLGPGNIGGRTRAFVIVPSSPNTMYVAGVSGGVWQTSDGGLHWTTHTDELANLAVNALALNPSDPRVLYAGTGEGYFREVVRGTGLPLRGAGIFRTGDGGLTWTRLPSTEGEDFQWVNDLVVSRADPHRVYAATRTGVWRSTDEGESWRRVLDPHVNGGCLDLAARTDTSTDWVLAACGTF
jgi:hypothetical protein